jgi:hypothetical protein
VAGHHAVHGAGLDLLHDAERRLVSGQRVRLEAVTKLGPGEFRQREQDRYAPSLTPANKDHFGVRDVAQVRLRAQRRQLVSGLRAVADGLDDNPVDPRPPPLSNEPAGFGVHVTGQDARLSDVERRPPIAESPLNTGALSL